MSIEDIKDEKVKSWTKSILGEVNQLIEHQDKPEILRDLYTRTKDFLDYWDMEDAWGTEGWDRENDYVSGSND